MTIEEELEDFRRANEILNQALNLRETNIKLLLQVNGLLREQCRMLNVKVEALVERAEVAEKAVAVMELELGVPVQ